MKVKNAAGTTGQSLRGARAPAASALGAAIPAFQSLAQRYPVTVVKRAFESNLLGVSGRRAAAPIRFAAKVNQVRAKYAQRSKRRRAGATTPQLDNIYELSVAANSSQIEELMAELRKLPGVEYVTPNGLARTRFIPNDPRYTEQWAHSVTSTQPAWDIERGNSSIVVAVIDTGVDFNHEDLSANMLGDCSTGCPTGTGHDFVDIELATYQAGGYQTLPGEDYTTVDNIPSDFNGHGTHCAGIAAARGDNALGVSGTAPLVRIMPIRAGFEMQVPGGGGERGLLEFDDIARAIRYAADNGADVVSMSFSGSESPLLQDAVAYAASLGVVLVGAAGNSANSIPLYPAAYADVVAVAATAENDDRASYSNFGVWVDVAAPGGDLQVDAGILSSVPTSGGMLSDPSGYRFLTGTSMATPYVAGVVALLLSNDPGRTVEQVKRTLRQAVDAPAGDDYIGTGRINTEQALVFELSNNSVTFDSLTDGQMISTDSFDIFGAVSTSPGTAFSVSFGSGVYPTSWTQIAAGSGSVSGLLGSWNTVGLSDNQIYTLRVVIEDGDATVTEARPVLLARTLHTGWPISVDASVNLGWGQNTTLADMDGDGNLEVFVGGQNAVHAVDGNGQALPGWPQSVFYGTSTSAETPAPAVGDIDADGDQDVVAAYGERVYAWQANNGQLLPNFPVLFEQYRIMSQSEILLTDLNGDGTLEIVLRSSVLRFNFTPESARDRIEVISSNGSALSGWPYTFEAGYSDTAEVGFFYPVLFATDTDGDGRQELISLIQNVPRKQAALFIWEHDGSLKSGYPVELPDSFDDGVRNGVSPTVADIDQDGVVEIGFFLKEGNCVLNDGQFVYKELDGTNVPGWPVSFQNQMRGAVASLADLDGDGSQETLFSTAGPCADHDFTVEAFKSDGTALSGWPVLVDAAMPTQVAVADVDGDGLPEVLAPTATGRVHAFSSNGTEAAGFPKVTSARGLGASSAPLSPFGGSSLLTSCPSVGDIDQDGLAELVIGSREGSAFAWDLAATAVEDHEFWPMSLRDPQHTLGLEQAPPLGSDGTLQNGAFNGAGAPWVLSVDGSQGGNATFSVVDGAGFVMVNGTSSSPTAVELRQEQLSLVAGTQYYLQFDAKATAVRDIDAAIGSHSKQFHLSVSQNTFGLRFTATQTTSNAQLAFRCGESFRDVTIDNVILTEVPQVPGRFETSVAPDADLYTEFQTVFNNDWLKVEAGRRVSYLKFTVPSTIDGEPGNPSSSAILRLRADQDPGNGTLRVFLGTHIDWGEGTAIFSELPQTAEELASISGQFTKNTDYDFDLTGGISGPGTYSLILVQDTGGNDVWFRARDTSAVSLRPRLIVESIQIN